MAKIELVSRYVNIPKVQLYEHLFILFTFDSESQHVITAGPFNEKHNYEFIFAHSITYQKSTDYCDGRNKEHYACLFKKIYEGDNLEIKKYHNTMLIKAEEINSQFYDYKLPDIRCETQRIVGAGVYEMANKMFSKSYCHIQNSNTVVKYLLKHANLNSELPTRDGKLVNAIGFNTEFQHNAIDKVTNLLLMAKELNKYQSNQATSHNEALNDISNSYLEEKTKHFLPIRKAQEKSLYPDNMPCCYDSKELLCKDCDVNYFANDEL